MNRIYLIISLIVAAILDACSGGGSVRPVIAVSVEPQRAMLQEIVGEKFHVVTLLGNGANPETYDPTMKARMEVENAAAFFTTGSMPFERRIAEALDPRVRVVDTSVGIVPIYGTHSHFHEHDADGHHHHHGADERDPHVWVSLRNARIMARNMFDAVCELDSANKPYYTQRFAALDARLDSLDGVFAQRLRELPSRAFAIWHPSLSYFARDYGLEQIAVGFENKEMSSRRLTEIVDEARKDSVKVFFFQKEYDSRQARTLNTQMGTRLVTINPMAFEWEKSLADITNALVQ